MHTYLLITLQQRVTIATYCHAHACSLGNKTTLTAPFSALRMLLKPVLAFTLCVLLHSMNKLRKASMVAAVAPQIAKLLIIPFVCAVESAWLGKVFSRSVIGSIVTVVAGVAIV